MPSVGIAPMARWGGARSINPASNRFQFKEIFICFGYGGTSSATRCEPSLWMQPKTGRGEVCRYVPEHTCGLTLLPLIFLPTGLIGLIVRKVRRNCGSFECASA